MSGNDDTNDGMAECGACRAVVPVDSEECPGCGISFTGVSETSLGECGACGALVPLESKACPQCGVVFVADDVISILGDWLSATGLAVEDLFKRFDENKDGVIEAHEFKSGLLALNIADLPESQVDRLVKALDDDGNGVIDLAELESTFAPTDNSPAKEVKSEEEEAEETAEDDSSEEDDESVDEEETAEDDSSEEDEEETAEDDSSEEDDESVDEEEIPDTPLGRMVKNFKDAGYGVKEAFEHMDVNNDGEIDGEEMTKALTEFGGGTIDEDDVKAVMEELDLDDNGVITLDELMVAFGVPAEEEEEKTVKDEKPKEKPKEFPTDLQKKLMSKKANDVFWPIMHTLLAVFALLWVLNGMGTFVDGTGGSIEFEGQTVKCDTDLHGKCKNSLTPLYGEQSSMPAGFYADGIFFMVLGFAGLGGSLYAHLVLMKAWRAKAKGAEKDSEEKTEDDVDSKKGEDSDDDDDEESKDDEESDEESEDDGESDDDDEEESEDDDESDDDDEEESEDDDESDDDEEESDADDDDIDVGSRVGVEVDGEEIFGTILSFDDDEDTVTIEDEETGDEIEAPQDSMFLE
jgi:Ca2+-binding EF-hand superfamily protein/RNA polymerase subunit RPABC4/transcription elongation factor Spt4